METIITNFSEDWDVSILYLSTEFELDRFINNGDLLLDRNHWKHTDRQTYTQTESDTLPEIGSSNNQNYCLYLP